MERLELLGQRLAKDLDREGIRPPGDQCVAPGRLEEFLSGTLDEEGRAYIEGHLGDCLICLNDLVVLRDCLHGVAAPEEVSSRLAARLGELMRQRKPSHPRASLVEMALRPFTLRIPAGWAVAMTAASILVTFLILPTFQRQMVPPGWERPSVSPPRPMTGLSQPSERGTPRTIAGVVIQVRKVTVGPTEAHVVTLRDSAGVQYSIFVWGPLPTQEGDSVQVEGVFQEIRDASGAVTYKGVATVFRPATPR